MATVEAAGAVPMITWDPAENGGGVPLSDIAAGHYDSSIVAAAQLAKAYGKLMYIRFGHEMNLAESEWGPGHAGDTSATFVAAWQHVVSVFRLQGATNVQWVWSPNVYCGGNCPFSSFYPGDSWVDWVALDGYNYSSADNDPWLTFDHLRSLLPTANDTNGQTGHDRQTGSVEQGGNKADWITQMFWDLQSEYPSVHALVWWNRSESDGDFLVNSSPSSLAAWNAALTSASGTSDTLAALSPITGDVTTGVSLGSSAQTPSTTPGPLAIAASPGATTPPLISLTGPAASVTGSPPLSADRQPAASRSPSRSQNSVRAVFVKTDQP